MTRYEVDSAQVATAAASVQARAGTIRSEVAAMQSAARTYAEAESQASRLFTV